MLIEIREPELEALIQARLEKGSFRNVEELLLVALRQVHTTDEFVQEQSPQQKNLVELFAESPFAGLAMDFERFPDTFPDVEAN